MRIMSCDTTKEAWDKLKEITNFVQLDMESIYQAWDIFKNLLKK